MRIFVDKLRTCSTLYTTTTYIFCYIADGDITTDVRGFVGAHGFTEERPQAFSKQMCLEVDVTFLKGHYANIAKIKRDIDKINILPHWSKIPTPLCMLSGVRV